MFDWDSGYISWDVDTYDPTRNFSVQFMCAGPSASRCLVSNGGCSPQATCSIVNGAVACKCNVGFTGNGKVCKSMCAVGNGGCDKNAACSLVKNTVTCKCKTGYEGNGKTCLPTVQWKWSAKRNCEATCKSAGFRAINGGTAELSLCRIDKAVHGIPAFVGIPVIGTRWRGPAADCIVSTKEAMPTKSSIYSCGCIPRVANPTEERFFWSDAKCTLPGGAKARPASSTLNPCRIYHPRA